MHAATTVTVIAALVSYALESPAHNGATREYVIGVAYLVLGTWGVHRAESTGTPRALVAYFSGMGLLLACWLVWSRGSAWLVAMPLVSQIALFGSTALALFAALVAAVFALLLATLPHSTDVYAAFTRMSAMSLFVVGFSVILKREVLWRERSETLLTKLGQANAALQAHAAQVAELSASEERNRMAREVHDGLGHYLTTIHMQLEAARAHLATEPARTLERLARAQQLAHQGLQDVRQSVTWLRSPRNDAPDLVEALRARCQPDETDSFTITFSIEGLPRPVSGPIQHTLMRVMQEALTNIRRHAHAETVSVVVVFGPERLGLQIEDDGVGDTGQTSGFGLTGMRERVQLLGGVLDFGSNPERGFRLTVEVPT